jgi:hypothetical protein
MNKIKAEDLSLLVKFLTTTRNIELVAFFAGFISSMSMKEFLKAPLLTTIVGSIFGGFYSIGATMTIDFVPTQILPVIIPGMILSTIYSKFSKETDK